MSKENKYSRWVFTIFEYPTEKGSNLTQIPSSIELGETLEKLSDRFVFQLEKCPTTERLHYQGCFITRIRKRHSTLLTELAVDLKIDQKYIHLDRMQGTFEQAFEYCSKEESRVEDKIYKSKEIVNEEQKTYKGNDISIFKEEGFYPWQKDICSLVFKGTSLSVKDTSTREVYWITDIEGNSGKSLFTKYLCYNNPTITKLAFGSGSQMRSSVVEEGAHKVYIIDIPRNLCNDDFQRNIYSVIEDLKNGFVKSTMYGKSKTLFMEPPIVIIFANFHCPLENLSLDRWRVFNIIDSKLVERVDERRMDL